MTEIERKFLVTQPPAQLEREPGDRIEQGYLAIDTVAEVRLRRRGRERTLTVKSEPRRTRVEEELPLDERRFAALWPLTEGRRVVKTRRKIPCGGAILEVDVYDGDLAGLVTAEVEFDSEEAADAFAPPPWLGREVTGDERYANQTLALHGRPGEDAAPAAPEHGPLPTFVAELPITRDALAFAAARHGGQRRDADAAPFVLHPLEVAHLVRGRDYPDHVVAAAVLHDVVEDTDTRAADVERRFGSAVAALVSAVSEPSEEGTYVERKARLRAAVAGADGDAVAIFAADKIAKTRELRMALARDPGRTPRPEQVAHYWSSLEIVESRLGHHPLARQLRFELEALDLMPPGRTPGHRVSGAAPLSAGARRSRPAGGTPRRAR